MTPETARLLKHWRSHRFGDIRPFFCQVEAVETAIWLTEVAPQRGREDRQVLEHLDQASQEANPGLGRLALKLAKTTVMAMLIAFLQFVSGGGRNRSARRKRRSRCYSVDTHRWLGYPGIIQGSSEESEQHAGTTCRRP